MEHVFTETPTSIRLRAGPMARGAPVLRQTKPLAQTVAGTFTETWPLYRLEEVEVPWRDLARRALQPNVHYGPDFLIAAARHLGEEAHPTILLVREAAGGRLIGLFPLVLPRLLGLGAGHAQGWAHPFMANGVPLVDAEQGEAALEAMLAWVGARSGRAAGVLFPHIDEDGPFAALVARFAASTARMTRGFDPRSRAVLRAPTDGVDARAYSKESKEMRRQRRRLGELGALTAESVRDRKGVREAFEHFLALEATGWKGRRGTAMMQTTAAAAFARSMTRALAGQDACRIDTISLDGRPIAVGIVIESGGRAVYWKTAYDEALARFSPGVQLTLDITARQLAAGKVSGGKRVRLTDSGAVEGHPMIDKLWPERLCVVDLFLGLDPARAAAANAAASREALRRGVRGVVKRAYHRATGRRSV